MWSASALLGLRCPLLLYWSFTPHAGQCVMPICCARASTCFLNCLCSLVLVLLIAVLFFLPCLLVLGGGASQRQRDERLHRPNTTLSSLFFCFLLFFSSSFLFWVGVCCVVRAQLCEHARNTTRALCFGFGLFGVVCVVFCFGVVCCPHHHCSLLTVTVFNVEHCVLLITL